MREDRRIVTALFADVVGSTAIAERVDPEDAREILGGAVALAVEQVDAVGGMIKDLAGDGVLALFGAPVAHEDDAERAVLCGLGIVSAVADHAMDVAERWGIEGLSVRVGIETGRAVMGPVGGGSRVEYGATGDVVNTAARLQAHADPGSVLVGAVTRAMVEERFTWGETRLLELKGKEKLTEASTVRAYEPRRHVPASMSSQPLIGRVREMELVDAALEGLHARRGSLLILVGEAGVGKSRLVREVASGFEAVRGGRWLEASAASYASSVPYLPFRHLVLGWLGLPLDARREAVREAVEARFASSSPGTGEALRALLPMLAAARDDETLDPESVQERTFGAVGSFLASLAAEGPVSLVLEDLHWCDPTSLALAEALVRLVEERPVLLVLTARPEPATLDVVERLCSLVPDRSVRVELPPLSRESDRELLRALLGGAALPRSLEERVLDTTDGNPFFVEEQVRALVASGALAAENESWRFVGTVDIEVPPTAERALLARIDRLPEPERETLLAASVLGSRFDGRLVGAVVGFDARDALVGLRRSEFLVELSDGPASSYRFRHALVQEAASASLLRRQRRILHGRAAAALESAYAGREDEIAGTLGRHLAEAGESDRAVGYLLRAARAAAASFANEEAAALAKKARSLVPEEPGSERRAEAAEISTIEATAMRYLARYDESIGAFRDVLRHLSPDEWVRASDARSQIGQVLIDDHRYGEALTELDVAEAILGERLAHEDAFEVWLDVQLARGNAYYWLADVERYSALLRRVEPLVEKRATERQRVEFYGAVRAVLLRRDRYVISDEVLRVDRKAYELGRASEDETVRAWASFLHGLTLMWHRDLDEAEPLLAESLEAAEHLGSVLLRSRALTYLMVTARLRGDVEGAARLVDEVRGAAAEAALPEYEAMASATAAWAAYRRADAAVVRTEGSKAIQIWAAMPNRYPLDWLAAFPLLAVAVRDGDDGAARRWAGAMLEDPQQPLPPEVAALLRSGLEAAAAEDVADGRQRFADAVERAATLGYL